MYSDTVGILEDAVIIDVSNSEGIEDVAVTFVISGCIADDTFSVIAFIMLYGLLLVPRNDLGKYWSSMDGEYSGPMDADADAVADAEYMESSPP